MGLAPRIVCLSLNNGTIYGKSCDFIQYLDHAGEPPSHIRAVDDPSWSSCSVLRVQPMPEDQGGIASNHCRFEFPQDFPMPDQGGCQILNCCRFERKLTVQAIQISGTVVHWGVSFQPPGRIQFSQRRALESPGCSWGCEELTMVISSDGIWPRPQTMVTLW